MIQSTVHAHVSCMYVVSLVLLLLSCCASQSYMLHALHYNYITPLVSLFVSPAEGLHFSALVCLYAYGWC